MKKSDVFQGTTMKAEDMELGQTFTAQILECEMNTYNNNGKTEHRCCLKLKGHDLLFAVNKTNWEFLEDALGCDDSDDWVGAWIQVECTTTKYMGKTVSALRITAAAFSKGKKPGPALPKKSAEKPPEREVGAETEADGQEECPF